MKRILRRLLGIESRSSRRDRTAVKKLKPPKPPKAPKPAPVDPFVDMAARYEMRLAREWQHAPAPLPPHSPEIAFLITPWLGTAVPMFNLETALLTRNSGHAVRLILDDTEVAQNAEVPSHREAVRRLVREASRVLPVTDLDGRPSRGSPADMDAARHICNNIAIWWERGETNAPQFLVRNPRAIELVADHLSRVRDVLAAIKPCRLFITGGIFGLSAVYVRVAEELGLPYTTYDCNEKVMLVSRDSVACHRRDFPRVMRRIQMEATPAQLKAAHRMAGSVLQLHRQGRDALRIQMVADQQVAAEPCDILVPLNIRWDAAALGCELCFPTCMSWLEALLAWVEQDGRFSICIREHPAGRFAGAGSTDDYQPLLQRFGTLGPRLRFIAADEPANTYDLVDACKLVLPYTSTIGIEAAMLGKPVVTHTSAYYANVGFAWSASDAGEYLRLVGDALDGRLVMDAARRERATMAYYVANCAWFLPGVFNPHPAPFEEWCTLTPAGLMETTGAREIVNALIHGEDMASCLHHQNMAAASLEGEG